jgi:hypothetical protein
MHWLKIVEGSVPPHRFWPWDSAMRAVAMWYGNGNWFSSMRCSHCYNYAKIQVPFQVYTRDGCSAPVPWEIVVIQTKMCHTQNFFGGREEKTDLKIIVTFVIPYTVSNQLNPLGQICGYYYYYYYCCCCCCKSVIICCTGTVHETNVLGHFCKCHGLPSSFSSSINNSRPKNLFKLEYNGTVFLWI